MRSPVLRTLANSTITNYYNRGKPDIGRPDKKKLICLECDWPASKCKRSHCKRYYNELAKIKEEEND